jgi:hypothetical protein
MNVSSILERLYTLTSIYPSLNVETHMSTNCNKSRILQGFISKNGITIESLYRLPFEDLIKLLTHYKSPTLTSRFLGVTYSLEHLISLLKLLQSQSSEMYRDYYIYLLQRCIVSGNSTLLSSLLSYSCPAYYLFGRLDPYLDNPLPSELVTSDKYYEFPCVSVDVLDILANYYDIRDIVHHFHLYVYTSVQSYMLYQIDETNAEDVLDQVFKAESILPQLVKILSKLTSPKLLHKLCTKLNCYSSSSALKYIKALKLPAKILASVVIDNDLICNSKIIEYLRRSEAIYHPRFISIVETIDTYKLIELYTDADRLLEALENLPFYENLFFFLTHCSLSEDSRSKLYNWSSRSSMATFFLQ